MWNRCSEAAMIGISWNIITTYHAVMLFEQYSISTDACQFALAALEQVDVVLRLGIIYSEATLFILCSVPREDATGIGCAGVWIVKRLSRLSFIRMTRKVDRMFHYLSLCFFNRTYQALFIFKLVHSNFFGNDRHFLDGR